MGGCEDVVMRGCANVLMWQCANVRMWGFDDVKMWWWEDVKIWGLADVMLWGLWRNDILKLFKVSFHNKTSGDFNISILCKPEKQIIEGIKIQW